MKTILIGLLLVSSSVLAQGYYPDEPHWERYHQEQQIEQQRELQEDFLRGQLQNQLIMKDLYEFDRRKEKRDYCREKYGYPDC